MAIFPTYLFPEDQISGWQNIKWGMSKSEVALLYNLPEPTSDGWFVLEESVYIEKQESRDC